MRNFLEGFKSLFHLKTLRSVVKNFWYSIFVFISTFVIFFAISYLFIELFENVLIKSILKSLSNKWVYLSPAFYINKLLGNPILGFFYPFILYLSYITSLAIASIFIGSILDPLSRKTQEEISYECNDKVLRTGIKKVLFNLTEEIKLLLFNITFIIGLFFLSYLTGVGTTVTKVIHYIILNAVLIFINGLIFLSYSYLRWGHSYLTITKIVLKKPGRIIGHGTVITLYFYLIAILIKNVPYSKITFGIIFAFNAIILPLAVVSGTRNAIEYSKSIQKFPDKKGILSRLFEGLITICAVIIIVTGIEIYSKSKSKVELLHCNYRVKNFNVKFAEDNSNFLGRILKRFRIKSTPIISFDLEINNPTPEKIYIFDFYINIFLNKKEITNVKIKGFVLKKFSNKNLNFNIKIVPAKIGIELLKVLTRNQNLNIKMLGTIKIDTWIGEIPIIFSILNS